MEKNQTIIIAIIAIVIVVIAAVLIVNPFGGNGGDDDDKYTIPDTRLLVFGNVNNDNFLNNDDMTMLQKMVDGKMTYDIKKYPFADVNVDGEINSEDITLLKKFLNGEKSTMSYINWNYKVASVNFPISGNVIGINAQCMDVAIIAGMYDNFVGLREDATKISTLSDLWYPGAAAKVKTVKNDTSVPDVQKCLALNGKIFLGERSYLPDSFVSEMKKADPDAAIVQLPINRFIDDGTHGSIDVSHTIVTLGVLANAQNNTKAYIDWVEATEKYLDPLLEKAAKKGTKEFVVVYNPTSKDEIWVDMYTPNLSEQYGDAMNAIKLGLKPAFEEEQSDGSYAYDIEKIFKADPDVIFISTWNMINMISQEEYEKQLSTMASYFSTTSAYKNEKVISFSFEFMGTIPAMSCLPVIGGIIWPDIFDIETGYDMMNDYLNKFTKLGTAGGHSAFDVRDHPGFAPDAWGGNQ